MDFDWSRELRGIAVAVVLAIGMWLVWRSAGAETAVGVTLVALSLAGLMSPRPPREP